MNSPLLQLLVLAGIAVFLILRLRNVLGTREGFEKPQAPRDGGTGPTTRRDFEVIEGGPDRDITDHVEEDSDAAKALADMKRAEPSFMVGDFLGGARGAYEMILMAFENGELETVKDFLDDDVYAAFAEVVEARAKEGLTIDAKFVGLREMSVVDASFDQSTGEGEVSMKFVAQLNSIVRDRGGDIIEGSDTDVHTQKDVWTFGRVMGSSDPNWRLVATGE